MGGRSRGINGVAGGSYLEKTERQKKRRRGSREKGNPLGKCIFGEERSQKEEVLS